jgi:O-antigen ligase
MRARQRLWFYNMVIVLAYLLAASLLLAVRGPGLKVLAVLALPAPLILWCAYSNLRRDSIFLLYMLVFAIVATPDIRVGGLPALRAEQGILALVALWCLYTLLTGKGLKLHLALFPGMFSGIGLFMLLSAAVGAVVGVPATLGDLVEFYKIIIYLGIFLVAATVIKTEADRWRVMGFANWSIALTGLIAMTQYLNPFHINERYVPRIAPTQFTSLVNNYFSPRVIGLSNNPNVYAVIAAVGVLLAVVLLFRTTKLHHLGLGGVSMLALLMTKSRTGLVLLVVMLASLYIIYFWQRVFVRGRIRLRPLAQMVMVFMVILIIAPLAFYVLPDSLVWRFREFADLGSATSWQARLEHWQENLQYFHQSPILGIGSAKSLTFRYAPDNEWLLLLRKFGILGTLWFILTFALPLGIYWPRLRGNTASKVYVSVLAGLSVYMFPAAVFHSYQLMPLVMILGGLTFSLLQDKQRVITLSGKDAGDGAVKLSGC